MIFKTQDSPPADPITKYAGLITVGAILALVAIRVLMERS